MTSIGSCGDGSWDINQHRYNKAWEYTDTTGQDGWVAKDQTTSEMLEYIGKALGASDKSGGWNNSNTRSVNGPTPTPKRAKIESSHDVGIGLAARLNKL
jgi:hypothetical protein|tara:strand:+ start:1695 stop:1991 length:297 start_codon:yes stop_codon:yes gene_type:complete